ncbi:hypothetical protein D3C87_1122350 [compost metagenome]
MKRQFLKVKIPTTNEIGEFRSPDIPTAIYLKDKYGESFVNNIKQQMNKNDIDIDSSFKYFLYGMFAVGLFLSSLPYVLCTT